MQETKQAVQSSSSEETWETSLHFCLSWLIYHFTKTVVNIQIILKAYNRCLLFFMGTTDFDSKSQFQIYPYLIFLRSFAIFTFYYLKGQLNIEITSSSVWGHIL